MRNGLLLATLTTLAMAGERLEVGRFSAGDLGGWQERRFHNQTRYTLVRRAGHRVLRAEARAGASGLVKAVRVDLQRTPWLNWCWQVVEPLPPLAERTRAGDDYAARLYLIKKGGLAFWKTRALNYVWSSSQRPGSRWPNAFAGESVMMWALRGPKDTGWRCEKRHLPRDWRKAFGRAVDHIDAVALMTDSDNSGRHTVADYGDIWFSSD